MFSQLEATSRHQLSKCPELAGPVSCRCQLSYSPLGILIVQCRCQSLFRTGCQCRARGGSWNGLRLQCIWIVLIAFLPRYDALHPRLGDQRPHDRHACAEQTDRGFDNLPDDWCRVVPRHVKRTNCPHLVESDEGKGCVAERYQRGMAAALNTESTSRPAPASPTPGSSCAEEIAVSKLAATAQSEQVRSVPHWECSVPPDIS
jgi:hypothetical protein